MSDTEPDADWSLDRINALADVMTSGLAGQALRAELHRVGAGMTRDEVFSAVALAVSILAADVIIAELETNASRAKRLT